jgi:erythromycin esterase-like protein
MGVVIMSALTDWVRKSAIMLPPPSAWEALPPSRLAALDTLVEGRQAAFLGELDHFVHEKSDFRLLLCRYLVSRGFTRLAEEFSAADGVRVDRYLQGDDAALRQLVTLGYQGDLRADRSDRPTGVLKASFDAYPVDLFAAEQTRFYRGLRAIGGIAGFVGLDVDALPGAGYTLIEEGLAGLRGEAVDRLRALMQRSPGETVAEEAVRVRRAFEAFKADVGMLQDAWRIRLVGGSLVHLLHSLEYVAMTYAASDYEALSPGLAFREQIMVDQASVALNHGRTPERVVFMGHALHLLKDDAAAGTSGPAGPGGGAVSSLGHSIVHGLGVKDVFSVWMLFGAGSDSQPFPDLPRTFDFPRQTLNAQLSAFREPLIFPLAGAPAGLFEQPWSIGHMYNATVPVTLSAQVDAICWVPRVSPMRG